MNRATILFLAHRIPFPPDKGDKIRSHAWLTHLAARHDVYCACFIDDPADEPYVADLRRICRGVAVARLSRTTKYRRAFGALVAGATGASQSSITESVYRDTALLAAITRWSAQHEFDAILAFSGAMAPYALAARARRRILDLCDCDSAKWLEYAHRENRRSPLARLRAMLLRHEACRLTASERRWRSDFHSVWVVHERERALLDPTGRCRTLRIIGNGVHVPPATPLPGKPVVTFIGALDYEPNIAGLTWFVREVWPQIHHNIPAAEFRIVGRAPTRAIRRLADRPEITLVGPVADVCPILESTRVSVAPLHMARGVQNKVLEAMAHARPVVTTTAAAAGIDADPGTHLLVADTPADFARNVVIPLKDNAAAATLAAAARERMLTSYTWTAQLAAAEEDLLVPPVNKTASASAHSLHPHHVNPTQTLIPSP